MKKALITLCCSVLFIMGCKEKAPPIDLTVPKVQLDTTYVLTTVPTTEPHNVLAEEYTGQTCPNCPAAHDLLNSLAASGRLNVVGLYIWGILQGNPPPGAKYDFRDRDSIATKISSVIYLGGPASGIPCAGIDRVSVGGVLQLYASQWSNAYNQRLATDDSLNLALTSKYDPKDSTAVITATVTYTRQVSTKQNITIVILEDSLIDKQEIPSGVEEEYLFTNVFRDMITSVPYGDPVIPAVVVKEPGRVNMRSYVYKVSPKFNPKHCRVVAFVHYGASEGRKDVLQSVQTKLYN